MPAPRKRTADTDDTFFAALAGGATVQSASRATGCSRQALYRRRIKDLAFDHRWREAEAAAAARKQQDRPRRRPGTTLPVFTPRGRSGHKRILSDGMLLARLKAVHPAYREASHAQVRSATPPTIIEEGVELGARMQEVQR
jgi:hypothetical protein